MAEKKKKTDLWYDIIKPFGKKVAKGAKKMGVGQDKEEWKKGAPARKAKRKVAQAKAAKKRAENKAKAKKGPVYSSKKDYSKSSKPVKAVEKSAKPDVRKIVKNLAKSKASESKPKEASPQPFGKAFSSARKSGKKTFTWKGKSYSTKTADDVKKEKAAAKSKSKGKGSTVSSVGKNMKKPKIKPAEKKDNVITSIVKPKSKPKSVDKPINDKPIKVKAKKKDIVDRFKEAGGKKAWKKALRMEDGGKVEGGGMFDWPTRDARNGGKK